MKPGDRVKHPSYGVGQLCIYDTDGASAYFPRFGHLWFTPDRVGELTLAAEATYVEVKA